MPSVAGLQSEHGFVPNSTKHGRMAHARQYARHAAGATAAALYARNDPPEFDANCLLHIHRITWELLFGMVCTPGWYSFARTCHATALSHSVCPGAALTHTDTFVVGGAKRATCKEIRIGISASALVRRGLRQPTHGLHGRPRETAQHRRPRWVADVRKPTARDHLWHPPLGRFIPMRPRRLCT